MIVPRLRAATWIRYRLLTSATPLIQVRRARPVRQVCAKLRSTRSLVAGEALVISGLWLA